MCVLAKTDFDDLGQFPGSGRCSAVNDSCGSARGDGSRLAEGFTAANSMVDSADACSTGLG